MPQDQNGATSGGAAVAEPVTGQAAPVSSGSSNQNGQAATQAQSAPAEDTFSSIDPKTLPPELQAVYKNLYSDYQKKTTSIAEEKKANAERLKKADEYDKLANNQQFKDYWSALSRGEKAEFKREKAEAEKRIGEKITEEEFAKAFESKDGFLSLMEKVANEARTKDQKEIENLKEKVGLSEAKDIIDGIATETGKDGQLVRPDFYAQNEDGLITGFLQLNPSKNPQEYASRVREAYDFVKNVTSKYYEKGRQEALKVIEQRAGQSTQAPTVTPKNAYSGPDPKKVDVSEAIAMARKGQRVPHNF